MVNVYTIASNKLLKYSQCFFAAMQPFRLLAAQSVLVGLFQSSSMCVLGNYKYPLGSLRACACAVQGIASRLKGCARNPSLCLRAAPVALT